MIVLCVLKVLLCVCIVAAQNNYPLNYICLTDGSILVENPDPVVWYSMSAYNLDLLDHCNTTDLVGFFGIIEGFKISGCPKNTSILVALSSRFDADATGDGLIAGISNENYVLFCNELDIEGVQYVAELLLTIVEPNPTDPTYVISSLPPVDVSFNITSSLWDKDYTSTITSASIGTLLKWHIHGPEEFDLLPVTCVAYGGMTVGGSTKKTLTSNGCSEDDTLISNFMELPLSGDRSKLYSDLYAFKFVSHDYITLACTVRICQDGSSSCTQDCTGRRRKRHVRPFSRRDLRHLRKLEKEMKGWATIFKKDRKTSRRTDSNGYVIKHLRIAGLGSSAAQIGRRYTVLLTCAILAMLRNIPFC